MIHVVLNLGLTDDLQYHTTARRGAKSVNLLGAKLPDVDLEE